ncbi:hypothetical protein A3A46_01170 [Candidatus Roizmanbacteria bacterium RIFCSPLOWO2_01_FULL_37_13]|uniref:Peptidase S9 prolyl oligopeptidase catalytic domain-containing protein n=1 Tax=Candidatus Roizmanbacteria bacterium RIFCSPHIGHO2_02_FULL_38_11 TaxID=1802039 RepID=A0A1F7GVW4_9BACT|nr:MAG: hypothetical protein A3C25_03845 [Candidatus Roizmanbacteria bacterium RIFCSPHIGHO2_02_FULL_38_11]OGK41551.1 MAG: hypothetical protein A3A46_01170 [Candidatus Roizmanbacteria bacterium RIFCSPLOWO2_01_FULL_37_13]
MKQILELVSFRSSDNLILPGLLYEPAKKTEKVALYLHGNGSSSIFYDAVEMNIFARYLNYVGVSFFPFNNRGAHWIKKLNQIKDGEKERVPYGMTYELIKECILDIDGAIGFLKKLGYRTFYLIGASTGANKIVVYHYYRRTNPVSKYILLSGGDDTGLYYEFEFKKNRKKFFDVLKQCGKKIEQGKGRDLVPKHILKEPLISYQSFYDTINPDGDYNIFPFNEYMNNLKLAKKPLFREYKTIDKPTLVIYGEFDEYCYGDVPRCLDILKKECPNTNLFTFKIIKETDHGFKGKDKELATTIANWL